MDTVPHLNDTASAVPAFPDHEPCRMCHITEPLPSGTSFICPFPAFAVHFWAERERGYHELIFGSETVRL